jgi:hypothetical protein
MKTTPLTKAYKSVLENFIEHHLNHVLVEEYCFDLEDESDDVDYIKQHFTDLMIHYKYPEEDKTFFEGIKRKIKADLKKYIDDDPEADIEGLALFRTKYYVKYLIEVVDYIVQDLAQDIVQDFFMNDTTEYSNGTDLIDFLQTFMNNLDTDFPEIKVKFSKDGYTIEDNGKNDITSEFLDSTEEFEEDFEFETEEDFLLSALVNNAPKKIVFIHPERYLASEVIEICQDIFGERLTIK